MSNAWFRMYAEFATDPKVQMMSEAMQRRLVVLMCLRCSDVTVTVDVTERDAAVAFALRINDAELEETKALFVRKGFIDDEWNLLAWDRRQFASDSSAERMRKHRAAKKKGGSDASDGALRHSDAIEQSRTDTDSEQKPTHTPPQDPEAPDPDPPPVVCVDELKAAGVAISPAAALTIPLRQHGRMIAPSHPDVIAAAAEGVDPQAIVDLIAVYPDKPATYLIAAARRQRAEGAKPNARGSPRPNAITQDFEGINY